LEAKRRVLDEIAARQKAADEKRPEESKAAGAGYDTCSIRSRPLIAGVETVDLVTSQARRFP
jgi:hypothetical protein